MPEADAARQPAAGDADEWAGGPLDDKTLAIAERAAQAAGLPLETWLERAIRRAATVAPPVRASATPFAEEETAGAADAPSRVPWRRVALAAPPLLLLAALLLLASLPRAGSGAGVSLAVAPATVTLALPPPAADSAEPSDPAELARWLEPRAKSGDATAQYRLGALYALGKGVEKDYARAAPLLRQAAESGLAEAQFDYGVLCEYGHGVPQDLAQAAAWYEKAAAQGYPDAALSLGYAYAKGMGVSKNMAEAAHWFHRAAELGVVNAQYNLAFLYEHGEGVAQSAEDAYAWYSLAAVHGDDGAKQAAERLAHDFSPQQMKDAEAATAALQASVTEAPQPQKTQ